MTDADKLKNIQKMIDEFTDDWNNDRDPDPIYLIEDIEREIAKT